MFDIQLSAAVSKVSVKVKSKDGITVRTCKITLEREFDIVIAAGLGGDAKQSLLALETGGMESCVLPMDAVVADAMLTAGDGDSVRIRHLSGVKAKGSASSEDGFPPSIKLEFEFPFQTDAWVFFGKSCGTTADILLKRAQMELVGTGRRTDVVDVTPPPGALF